MLLANFTLFTLLIFLEFMIIRLSVRSKPDVELYVVMSRQRVSFEPVLGLGVQVLLRNVEDVASMGAGELYGLEERVWVLLATEGS